MVLRWRLLLFLPVVLLIPVLHTTRAADDPRLTLLARLVADDSPKVRLEALRALAKIPTAESATLALSVLDRPMDPTLDYALWLTINDLSEPWIEALQSGRWTPEGRENQLEFALRALKPEQASRVLSQALQSRPLSREGSGPWIELIGAAGSPEELRQLFDQVLSAGFDETASARALKALGEATRLRKAQPAGEARALSRLFDTGAESVRVEAVRLAGIWKDSTFVAPLAAVAGAPANSPAVRFAAFDALRQIGGPDAQTAVKNLVQTGDPAIRLQAIAALAALDLGAALPGIIEVSKTTADESAALEFWRAVLANKGAGKRVAESLPEEGLSAGAARAGMRAAREGGRNEVDLVLALSRGAGLGGDATAASEAVIRDLAARAQTSGDPRRGEWIYRRADLACVSCHAIGGVGGKVGPDMTSIGASAPADYLVESVLLPNVKIKEGFHSLILTGRDGTEWTGTLARETPEEIVLRTAAGTEQAVPKTDVTAREQGTLSLMPAGLLDPLNEQEQLDLFAFLSRLGKPGDFDAAQGGVARYWRIGQTIHTDAQAGKELWPLEAPWTDRRWTAAPALVNGVVPKELIDEITKAQFWTARLGIYAGTEFTTPTAGAVRFTLTAGPGAELWVGGTKVGGPGESTLDLAAGTHRVLVKLDPRQVPDLLKLESRDGVFRLD